MSKLMQLSYKDWRGDKLTVLRHSVSLTLETFASSHQHLICTNAGPHLALWPLPRFQHLFTSHVTDSDHDTKRVRQHIAELVGLLRTDVSKQFAAIRLLCPPPLFLKKITMMALMSDSILNMCCLLCQCGVFHTFSAGSRKEVFDLNRRCFLWFNSSFSFTD